MLRDLLSGYRAASPAEEADLQRCAEVTASSADPWARALPLHFTASAVVVHPATRRVLLRWHARLGEWLQVGGHGDPGEHDPLAIALREGREETGLTDLTPWPDASLVHLVVCDVPASATEPAHQHADLRFVLATATPDAIVAENESSPLRWLGVAAARAEAAEANLGDTLDRVARLFEAS